MSYSISLDGSLVIAPPLTAEHRGYLAAFAATRRVRRDAVFTATRADPVRMSVGLPAGDEGGYFVGAGGMLGQEGGGPMLDPGGPKANSIGILDFNSPPMGQPHLWCCWQPATDGSSFSAPEAGSHYDPLGWLRYLVAHFLAPWGYRLNGDVSYRGADPADGGRLAVRDNVVTYEPTYGFGPLAEGWGARERGEALMAAQDLEGACAAFEQVVALAPDWADSWWLLGGAQARLGRVADSVTSLDKSIARETDAIRREARRLKLHGLMRQTGKSEEGIKRASNLRGESRFDEAILEYEAYFAALPADQRKSGQAVSALIGIGLCEQGAGRHDLALAAYVKAAQTCPEDPSGWTYLAYLQSHQLNAPHEAIPTFRLAIQAGNDGSPIQNELGMACGRSGLHEEARDAFIEGTNADPDDPLPWLNLGHTFLTLGDPDEAIGCFERAASFHDSRCHEAALEGLAVARDELKRG